jgi:hypothetical protein
MLTACCGRPRGLGDTDVVDHPRTFGKPVNMGSPSNVYERDFGPDESVSSGAFLKLRAGMTAARLSVPGSFKTGNDGRMQQSPQQSPQARAMTPQSRAQTPLSGRLATVEADQKKTEEKTPVTTSGWLGSLGSSVASIGSNLGVPLMPGSPSTQTLLTGILKNSDATGVAQMPGGESFNSQQTTSSSATGMSGAPPLSTSRNLAASKSTPRGDITARRCECMHVHVVWVCLFGCVECKVCVGTYEHMHTCVRFPICRPTRLPSLLLLSSRASPQRNRCFSLSLPRPCPLSRDLDLHQTAQSRRYDHRRAAVALEACGATCQMLK